MMTNRLCVFLWFFVFFVFLGILSGYLWIVGFRGDESESPAAKSALGLCYFSDGIGLSLAKNRIPLETMLSEYEDMDLISALVKLIERDVDLKSVSNKLQKKDGWGRMYNVEWRTNMVGIVSPMLSENRNALLIWSSGINGTNEYGHGDDIFGEQDWTIYRNENK